MEKKNPREEVLEEKVKNLEAENKRLQETVAKRNKHIRLLRQQQT